MADTKEQQQEVQMAQDATCARPSHHHQQHQQQPHKSQESQQKAPMPAGRARKLKQPRTGDMPRVLAELLHEPKVALLHRVVRIVGPKASWELLKEALRVEQQGGQQVNAFGSGDPDKFLVLDAATQEKAPRQRTTGGIFFALLRDKVPRETYREVYEVENKKKKDFKKRVRYQKKQKFEREIAQLGFDVLNIDQQAAAAAAAGGGQPAIEAEEAAPTAATRGALRSTPRADDVEDGEVEDMELL